MRKKRLREKSCVKNKSLIVILLETEITYNQTLAVVKT